MEGVTLVADIFTILGVIVAGIAIWQVFKQIGDNRRRTRAQYISDLVRDFQSHFEAYKMLSPGGKYHEDSGKKLLLEDIPLICEYLGFFEKIYFLVQRNVIELDAVAKLFTYRLTLATANKKIQSKILDDEKLGEALCKVVYLHNEIVKYWEGVRKPLEKTARLDTSKYRLLDNL